MLVSELAATYDRRASPRNAAQRTADVRKARRLLAERGPRRPAVPRWGPQQPAQPFVESRASRWGPPNVAVVAQASVPRAPVEAVQRHLLQLARERRAAGACARPAAAPRNVEPVVVRADVVEPVVVARAELGAHVVDGSAQQRVHRARCLDRPRVRPGDVALVVVVGRREQRVPRRDQRQHAVAVYGQHVLAAEVLRCALHPPTPLGAHEPHGLAEELRRGEAPRRGDRRAGR